MSDRDTKPSATKETPSAREERLAEALRANLRRRKKTAKDSQTEQSSSPESP
jgi:hypothetical protein